MKYIFVYLLTIFSLSEGLYGQTGWIKNIEVLPSDFTSLHFVNINTGFISGNDGLILKTTNSGLSWFPSEPKTALFPVNPFYVRFNYKTVYFKNVNTGFTIGERGCIFMTTTGGANWTQFSVGANYAFQDMQFINDNYGFSCSDIGFLRKTVDGGLNWDSYSAPLSNGYRSFYFSDHNTGFMVGTQGRIVKTVSGAEVWEPFPSGVTSTLNSVHFLNNLTGFVAGDSGVILKSTIGGFYWDRMVSNTTQKLNTIFFTDVNTGYAAGNNGTILKTTNGAISWSAQSSGTIANLSVIKFVSASTGFIIGNQGTMLRTSDAGASWQLINPGAGVHLHALSLGGSGEAYICGNPFVIKTTNNGITWEKTNFQFSKALNDVHFKDANTGFVVNDEPNSSCFRTTNKGASWSQVTGQSMGHSYRAIHFPTPDTGFVMGTSGNMMGSIDGGANWGNYSSGFFESYSTFFTSGKIGYRVGREFGGGNGAIHKTNGGNFSLLYATPPALHSVHFVNTLTGYVCGDSGKIVKTTNAGVNWNMLATETRLNLKDIYIKDSIGYAVGDSGIVLKTTNAGQNWQRQSSNTSYSLKSVSFRHPDTAIACGEYGIILRTVTGGVIGITPISTETPSGFKLYQNYPNPFNPATNIKFDVLKTSHVNISVYNLLGEKISEIVNENLKSGVYSVKFDGTFLTSGVYFVRMGTSEFNEVKKILLIK